MHRADYQRVFCVGMNKTGTSSLNHCFRTLGIQPVASPPVLRRAGIEAVKAILERGDHEPALRLAVDYRGFEDRPWNMGDMYRRLDERFPDSKFILTVRDPDTWWRSVSHWIGVTKPRIAETYRLHLGAGSLDRDEMVRGYLAHNDRVQAHFAGTDRLLVMDIEKGAGWEALCEFLGLAVPRVPFPHANRQAYTETDRLLFRNRRLEKRKWVCSQCGSDLPSPVKEPKGRGKFRALTETGLNLAHRSIAAFTLARRRRSAGCAQHGRNGPPPGFAVVTTFFNPCGSPSRNGHLPVFYEGMRLSGVPLLTVEVAIGSQEYAKAVGGYGEVLRMRCRDVLWHKESALNAGIRQLAGAGYDKIAWVDADVLFDDPRDWAWRVAAALDDVPVCQAFSHALQGVTVSRRRPGIGAMYYRLMARRAIVQPPVLPCMRHPFGLPLGLTGFAWAARAEVLKQVPLYDRAIVGGADRLIFAAGLQMRESWESDIEKMLSSQKPCRNCGSRNGSPAFTGHVLEWARRWNKAVGGRAGFVYQRIRDCYHGTPSSRGYMWRKEVLFRHAYDPERDVCEDGNGCLQWATDKPELRADVAAYFVSRMEGR